MSNGQPARLHDSRVDVTIVLSSLWVAMLFVFAYVDIVTFFRADMINGSVVEILLLLAIARTAWRWPHDPAPAPRERSQSEIAPVTVG